MQVILYARVSTGDQADKQLSLPAQVRTMRSFANERGWTIADVFQDVGTGRTLRNRPGLAKALSLAKRDKSIGALVVHKVDRLSRNVFNYLITKAKLQADGVNLISVVERFEPSPMGEFLEHIMAAQAEFYSANLSEEVKKGMTERLRRGKWTGPVPVGYLKQGDRVVTDPARAEFIRYAFKRWATGETSSRQLEDELYRKGLVSKKGKRIRRNQWCVILKNPFYKGQMKSSLGTFPGIHPPLVSEELFERCQAIFRAKGNSGRPRRRLTFLLSKKMRCPHCAAMLSGEQHLKPSGKIYKYYRCSRKICKVSLKAEPLEAAVIQQLLEMEIPKKVIPVLRTRIAEERERDRAGREERLGKLRQDRARLEKQLTSVLKNFAQGLLTVSTVEIQQAELEHSIQALDHLIAEADKHGPDGPSEAQEMLTVATRLEDWLRSGDVVEQQRAVDAVVERVLQIDQSSNRLPEVVIRALWLRNGARRPIAEIATTASLPGSPT